MSVLCQLYQIDVQYKLNNMFFFFLLRSFTCPRKNIPYREYFENKQNEKINTYFNTRINP